MIRLGRLVPRTLPLPGMAPRALTTTLHSFYRKPNTPWPKPHDFFQKRKSLLYYNMGLYTLVFGLCYLTIPLYKIFCESVGLDGDLEQKDYSVSTADSEAKINVFRKFKVIFEAD